MLSSYNTIINKGNKRISMGTTMRVTAVYAIRHVLKPETTKRNERNETTETSETTETRETTETSKIVSK